MAAQFHDEETGRPRELRPDAPPQVDFLWDRPRNPRMLATVRAEAVVAALWESLAYLGYTVSQDSAGRTVDLYWGITAPATPARCWLKPGPTEEILAQELIDKGFALDEIKLWCLSRRYRQPLKVSLPELERSRDDYRTLRDLAGRLAALGNSAPSALGLAGYKKRFRDALARDLDLPDALASLWDALRPGALSPGSQLGMLREAGPILGLSFFEKTRK